MASATRSMLGQDLDTLHPDTPNPTASKVPCAKALWTVTQRWKPWHWALGTEHWAPLCVLETLGWRSALKLRPLRGLTYEAGVLRGRCHAARRCPRMSCWQVVCCMWVHVAPLVARPSQLCRATAGVGEMSGPVRPDYAQRPDGQFMLSAAQSIAVTRPCSASLLPLHRMQRSRRQSGSPAV